MKHKLPQPTKNWGAACKRVLQIAMIVIFLFSLAPDLAESRRSFGGRSFSRSFSRSSSRRSYSAPKRSYSSTRSRSTSSRSSTSRSTRSTSTRPTTSPTSRSTRSSGSSYGSSRSSKTPTTRASSTARQKQTATNKARTTNTTSTRSNTATRSQQRKTTAQNRKQVRQLKAENRTLKRQVKTANRQTANARREQRSTININNYRGYYPIDSYSIYSYAAASTFNNLMFGIYFHDYYNHAIRRSYLWHYHHRDYDRSHWDAKKQAEYEYYKEYYESQGIEPNPNYVDPGTNRDEDYIASYVEENPDKFYGENVEVVTVDELPDEEALKQELLASAGTPSETTETSRAPPTTQQVVVEKPVVQRVIVEKKTSGAMWFVLIFGSLLIVGVIMLVMYNKGYF